MLCLIICIILALGRRMLQLVDVVVGANVGTTVLDLVYSRLSYVKRKLLHVRLETRPVNTEVILFDQQLIIGRFGNVK